MKPEVGPAPGPVPVFSSEDRIWADSVRRRQRALDAEAARIDQVDRIVEAINPMVAAYLVAKLFNDKSRLTQLGIALAGAMAALKATFDETSFANLCRGLGIDPIEATELVERLAKLSEPSES